ncbi:hypothetical protein ACO0K3_15215 [Undibacterium sp. Rencai35W]|uniref:hypothetical protein n=1 Tax=Undibacterium sp. Rencai35W TaxID=3413046 RepID=UPI003BF1501D
MYELPENFDENQLVGYYLGEVGIGAFTTNLRFAKPQTTAGSSSTINICIKGNATYFCGERLGKCEAENPRSMTALVDLLMADIDSVQRVKKASLKILFKHGEYILFDGDSSPDYESYLIQISGGEIIVV